MNQTRELPRPGVPRIAIGLGILLIATLGGAILTKPHALAPSTLWAATALAALAVLAMAWAMAPATPYARWAHWASAAVLASWVIASPAIAGSPEAWRADMRPMLWLMPWFVMTAASTSSRRSEGVCATQGNRAGWILVGTSGVMGAVLTLAGWIGRML
jgi:hypothetical protein